MSDGLTTDDVAMRVDFAEQTGAFDIEFKLKWGGQIWDRIRVNDVGTSAMSFRIWNGGALQYRAEGGGWVSTGVVFAPNQWEQIKLSIVPLSQTYTLYQNGVLQGGGDFPFSDSAISKINRLQIDTGTVGTGDLYVDTIDIYVPLGGPNSAPTDLTLSGNSVLENSINGTVVGTVTATDPDAGETFSYLLTDDAGGRFAIDSGSGQITVANGSLLDFETDASHSVKVQVTDSANNFFSKTFVISVTNVVEGSESPAPGDRFNQFFDNVPLTPFFDYTATTISFNAASGEIRDSANGFGPLSTGDFIYVSGAANDRNRSTWEITSKVNNGRLKISPDNNANFVVNEGAGNAVRVLQGLSESDIQSQFFGNPGALINTALQRVIADPDIPGGKIVEQISPKGEFWPSESSLTFVTPLADINAQATEVYAGFWVKYLPGQSGGFLQSSLSSAGTSSFTIENIFGDINDIPVDNVFGDGTSPRINAGEFILGDPDGVHEVITFQGRSSSGPNYTIQGSLVRGVRGTTARAWPAGTQVTVGFDWGKANKLPIGLRAGTLGGLAQGKVPGTDYASVRLYQSYNFGSPRRPGSPTIYRYDENVTQRQACFGVDDTPAGYTGGPKELRQNQWEAMEMRAKMNSAPGVADGEMSAWLNGELVFEKTNIEWMGHIAYPDFVCAHPF